MQTPWIQFFCSQRIKSRDFGVSLTFDTSMNHPKFSLDAGEFIQMWVKKEVELKV